MKSRIKTSLCWLLMLAGLLLTVSGCGENSGGESSTPVLPDENTSGLSTTVTTVGGDVTEGSTTAADTTTPGGTGVTTQPSAGSSPTAPSATQPTKVTTKTTKAPATSSEHYRHSAGKVFQNMTVSYASLPSATTIAGKYGYQDLGSMQLEEYPIDGVYDQAFNCIKVGDTYKMWWGRACPMDTIWYAESKDMKNWYNARCLIDLKGYETSSLKQMLLWSSVLYVDGKYHMYFEAPCTIDDQGEYNNNIFYATSKDGFDWTFFPNNKNPQPVIKNPNTSGRTYGVGQPKAFYKDGAFYVVYTDASTGGGDIRVAKSEGNGYSFTGTVASHPKILSGVAGASVRYNETTKKYYMMVAADAPFGNKSSMGVYMQESDDLYDWPYSTIAQLKIKGAVLVPPSDVTKKANPDFVTNEKGIVTGETMIFMYMDGVMPGAGDDHRVTHTTWDGRLGVVTAGSLFGKTATLPNGKPATAKNLVWYQDGVATWARPSVKAASGTPKVDGTADGVYGQSGTALVESVTWEHWRGGGKPTDTTGTARFVWDTDALYVYVTVKDGTPLEGDGVTVFVHGPGASGGITADNAYRLTVSKNGRLTAENGAGEDITTLLGAVAKIKSASGGYTVEMRLPWYAPIKSQVKKGVSVGVDICINDGICAKDALGLARRARIFWSDYAAENQLNLDRYGRITLQ